MVIIRNKIINYRLQICASELNSDIHELIHKKCNDYLYKNIVDNVYINDINNVSYNKEAKIINSKLSILCVCNCSVIDPILNSVITITINDINKMGAYYKYEKLCIFIPQHLMKDSLQLNTTVQIEIIGKRIEDTIICIGKCI